MSSNEVISIPTTSVSKDNVVYYNVNIKMPLRSSSVLRRYSEFTRLVDQLCYEIGINNKDFPYKLPLKASIWSMTNKNAVVSERQIELTSFLNQLLKDKDLQNHPLVHDFLQLPASFKVTSSMFERKGKDASITELIIPDAQAIDSHKWLEYSRLFKYHINDLRDSYNTAGNISMKVDIRDKINKIIKPNLAQLSGSLTNLLNNQMIDKREYNKRQVLLESLKTDLDELFGELDALNSKNSNKQTLFSNSRRVLGGANTADNAKETNETLPLDNQELLQLQLQIHLQQDQDVAQLRKLIQRQKEIGQTINTEVEEQNELLDQFNEDVDKTTDRLQVARKKARNIL